MWHSPQAYCAETSASFDKTYKTYKTYWIYWLLGRLAGLAS